jgi:hypothetical protein
LNVEAGAVVTLPLEVTTAAATVADVVIVLPFELVVVTATATLTVADETTEVVRIVADPAESVVDSVTVARMGAADVVVGAAAVVVETTDVVDVVEVVDTTLPFPFCRLIKSSAASASTFVAVGGSSS